MSLPIPGEDVQFWRDAHWETIKDDSIRPGIAAEIERIFDLLEARYRLQRDLETGRNPDFQLTG